MHTSMTLDKEHKQKMSEAYRNPKLSHLNYLPLDIRFYKKKKKKMAWLHYTIFEIKNFDVELII